MKREAAMFAGMGWFMTLFAFIPIIQDNSANGRLAFLFADAFGSFMIACAVYCFSVKQ